MEVRVITLRYQDGTQGFSEQALTQATAGREVLEVREHFFTHGNVPHLALVLMLGDGPAAAGASPKVATGPDPAEDLPEGLRGLYRDLKRWRNDRARADGVPAYTIARNTQLAEICRKQPRSLAALREIEGFGEATCAKYGKEIVERMPTTATGTSADLPQASTEGGSPCRAPAVTAGTVEDAP